MAALSLSIFDVIMFARSFIANIYYNIYVLLKLNRGDFNMS